MSNFGATSAGPFGNLNIASSTFLRNTVVGSVGYGGAMYIDVGVTVAVTGTSFTGNTVTGDFDEEGGAVRLNVFSDLEQSSFTGCTFQGNAAVVPATSSVPESTATAGSAGQRRLRWFTDRERLFLYRESGGWWTRRRVRCRRRDPSTRGDR